MDIDLRRHRGFIALTTCQGHAGDARAWLPAWLRRHLPFLARARPESPAGCVLVRDTAR